MSSLTVSSSGSSSSKAKEVRSSKPRTSAPASSSSTPKTSPTPSSPPKASANAPVSATQRLQSSTISTAPSSRILPTQIEAPAPRDDVQISADASRDDTDLGRYEQIKNLTGSLTQATVNKISSTAPSLARRDEAQGIESTSRTSQASKVKTQLLDNSLPLTSTSASDSQTRWKLNYPNQSATNTSAPPKSNPSTPSNTNPNQTQLPASNPRAASPLDPLSGSANSGLWSKDPAWQGLMPKSGSNPAAPGEVGQAVSSAAQGIKNTVNPTSKGATEGAINSAAASVKENLLKPGGDSKSSPDTRFPGDPKQSTNPDALGGLSKTLDTKGIADKILGKLPAFGGFGAGQGDQQPSSSSTVPNRVIQPKSATPESDPNGKAKADGNAQKPQGPDQAKSNSKGGFFGSIAKVGQDLGKVAGDAVKTVGGEIAKGAGELGKIAGDAFKGLPELTPNSSKPKTDATPGDLRGGNPQVDPKIGPKPTPKPGVQDSNRTGQTGKPQVDPKVGARDPAAKPGPQTQDTNRTPVPQETSRPQQGGGDVARRGQTEPATRTGQPQGGKPQVDP
ncbi:hypothetical protein JST97_16475, partial [bacterium]|nr:hypothetical protein [bacterium]